MCGWLTMTLIAAVIIVASAVAVIIVVYSKCYLGPWARSVSEKTKALEHVAQSMEALHKSNLLVYRALRELRGMKDLGLHELPPDPMQHIAEVARDIEREEAS